MNKRLKILIVIAVILAVIAAAVWYSPRTDKNQGKSVVAENEPFVAGIENEQLSQAKEILDTLALLKTISLNSDFFNSAALKGLYDFSIILPVPEAGRNNPFAP